MRQALRLAARGRYGAAPNPMVGAVVVRDGEVTATGYHARVGEAHAEAAALEAAGDGARGATLFVTLEPCDHLGRTPPCTEAVLRAGIARVVACHRDPDPRVRGQGVARLRQAGVEVEVGPLADEAVRLNLRYLVPRLLGRPMVTLKWAMSLDGRIATAGGESRWISSPQARRRALRLREEHDAILVGSGTVLADDPRLTRRLGLASGRFSRVVLDRRLRTPSGAALFREAGPVLIYTERPDLARQRELAAVGATVVALQRVEPPAVLADLAEKGLGSVLVEGGGEIHAAFVAAGCYDQVEIHQAPLLVGGREAPGPLGGAGLGALGSVPRLADLSARRLGDDLWLRGYRPGCLPGLLQSVAG